MQNQYNWNRRWIHLGTRADKSTDLSAFSLRWFSGSYPPPTKGFTLDELAEIPVIILLGEPGIGKSSEITSYFERASKTNDQPIWKLQKYPPNNFTRFFEHSQFQEWHEGRSNLILFLDSFDESTQEPVSLGRALTEALENVPGPLDKLFLRIACRTADWSQDTTARLREIFGEDYVFTVELDALGQSEVVEAAIQHQIDPYQFLEQIEQNALSTLTLKPITLIDLLKEYSAKNGVLPDTRNLLYENMCRRLCEEHNPYHGESERHRKFTVDELFIEAARLATIMLATRRLTVWMPASTKDIVDGSIAINELHNGSSAEDRITRAALHTGFFASRGTHQLGWAHLSYAEFLAAFYMHQKMSLPQIKSLLVHSDGQKIVPQLREVAAWLASMDQDFFDFIVDLDPETLFQSDLIIEDADARATLTHAFLDLYHREILIEVGRLARYRRLNHPKLSKQLIDFVHDNSRHHLARYVAIDIIRACSLQSAANSLVDLALDPDLDNQLRSHAAHTVAYVGDSTARLALKPLVFGDVDDKYDELKGAALRATWPEYLSTHELFSVLTPRKQEHFVGQYVSFLRVEIIDHISPNELPVALKWAVNIIEQYTDAHHHIESSLQDVIDEIVYKSWIHLEIPDVSSSFAQLILQKILRFQPLFGTERRNVLNEPYKEAWNEFLHNEEKRHQILLDIIELVSDTEFDFHRLTYSIPLLNNTDLGWLLDLLQTGNPLISQDNLLRLIQAIFRHSNYVHMDVMVPVIEQNKALQDAFYRWFYVLLDSENAHELRRIYQQNKEHEAEWQRIDEEQGLKRIDPPPLTRLNEVLERCEQGEIKEWWQTNRWLSSDDYGGFANWYDDLRRMPNWDSLDDDTRKRLISLGIDYIYEVNSETTIWFGQSVGWHPTAVLSAYRMLFLLYELDYDLPIKVWQNWMPAIIVALPHFMVEGYERHWQFISVAYQKDPEGLRFFLRKLLKTLNNSDGEFSYIENFLLTFERCFDDELAHVLIEYLNDENIKSHQYRGVLYFLLRKQNPEAASKAVSDSLKIFHKYPLAMVQNTTLSTLNTTDKLLRLTLAQLLYKASKQREEGSRLAAHVIAYAISDDLWKHIWRVIQTDENMGRRIIEKTASIYDDRKIANIGSRISEKEVADLFLWITKQYPHEEDPELRGLVSQRHNVSDWRNSLLDQLAAQGTIEALKELDRIALVYPDLYRLKRLRKLLVEQLYIKTWHSPQVTDVLSMLKSREQRFVQTANQLLDAIIEALDRLQKRLQGETPSAIDLWNETPFTPRDENALSNYIKRHLDTDLEERGIIVNREVEIRRRAGKEGAAPGEVPDLYVTSFSHSDIGKLNPLIVLIEVKGNWHDDLMTAAQTQLVDRYLRDNNRATCGLYLVGWFNCEQWDKTDYKRAKAMRHGFDSLSEELKAQAVALSNKVLDIRTYVLNVSLREEKF